MNAQSDTFAAAVRTAIKRLADSGNPFTADDVREYVLVVLDVEMDRPNIGGFFNGPAKRGEIRCIGTRPTQLPGGHARRYPLWVGA